MVNLKWTAAPVDREPAFYKDGMNYLVDGQIKTWTGPSMDVYSPVYQMVNSRLERRKLGVCALLDGDVARAALKAATHAYDKGRGEWPTASVAKRIACLSKFLDLMQTKRLEVARLITWEIGKPWKDSLIEFDRTIDYGRQTIDALKAIDRQSSGFARDGGFVAQIRRSPFGVALCMGPYNYPLNETFAVLLPAIVMGNPVIVKLPRLGMLCTMPLLEAFAQAFPRGVVNVLTGEGPVVVTPVMESGSIDLLAFIGSAHVANQIRAKHPHPNRMRSVLGLGAKNPAIVLPDADLKSAIPEVVSGALTFNGQRCTALKIIFVHKSIADIFVKGVVEAVSKLISGMPFDDGATLTPLPNDETVAKMKTYVDDAVAKGAHVLNADGGAVDRTYFHPAVVYPVSKGMALYEREQFGPIVPIVAYEDTDEILDYMADMPYGQQASIFGKDPKVIGPLLDALVNQVCRVNLNTQCRRGPDTFPFSGRKDSAEGTLSITDALRVFSIRTLVASKDLPESYALVQGILQESSSQFLTTDYLF